MLQQKDDIISHWSTMGGESREGEDAQVTFLRVIHELLNIDLKIKQIYPVYDYFHSILEKMNFVFYAEVNKILEFRPSKGNIPSWVTFDQTLKLLIPAHTKQDVVVGERVIRLKERQDQANEILSMPQQNIII